MKLPWDEKYLKISFHVAVTCAGIYALKVLIDAAAYIFTNVQIIFGHIGSVFSTIMSVFSVLIVALIIAYLLDPVADFFQKKYETLSKRSYSPLKMPRYLTKLQNRLKPAKPKNPKHGAENRSSRTAGAAITYAVIILTIVLAGVILFSRIGKNGNTFFDDMVFSATKTLNDFSDLYVKIQIKLEQWGLLEYISKYLTEFFNNIGAFVESFGNRLISSMTSAGSGILNFFISFVIAFYIIKDKAAIAKKTDELMEMFLPTRANRFIKNLCGDVDAVFSGYIRGQLLDAVIMAVLISVWLTIAGVKFAVIIGIISGFSNLIPYFGAFVGFILSVTIALLNGSPLNALIAAIGIIVLQQIDGMFIVPKVVGKSVSLGPVPVLLSLAIAGQLFGIPGMILAVPVCAIIKMFFVRFVDRRKVARRSDKKAGVVQ